MQVKTKSVRAVNCAQSRLQYYVRAVFLNRFPINTDFKGTAHSLL